MVRTWLIILLVMCFIVIVRYLFNLFYYWKKNNVPYIPLSLQNTTSWLGHLHQTYYNWAKQSGFQHIGLFTLCVPTYMPIDISIVKNILTTDFHSFSDRGVYYNEKEDPMGATLFTLQYPKWSRVRSVVTPAFTSSKLKTMVKTLVEIGRNLKDAVDKSSRSGQPVDIKIFLLCYTMDIIGSCAFGLDCNTFKNPNSEFTKYGVKYMAELKSLVTTGFLYARYPRLANFFKRRSLSKDLGDFYWNITRETIKYRETNNVIRNDFLQLMMNFKNDGDESLTNEEIAAQCLAFFVAGHETSSGTLCFCFYELSLNPEIREKASAEIDSVLKKYDGELTYEALMEMQYTGQIIDETLRKYPVIPQLSRICIDDYQVPNTDLILEKGTVVVIPVFAIQNDPDHFPNPEVFDPERFSEENKSKIEPSTYLPFGDGPRNCIGFRFALIAIKVALVTLLQNFNFSINKSTTDLSKLDPELFSAGMVNTMWLDVSKVQN